MDEIVRAAQNIWRARPVVASPCNSSPSGSDRRSSDFHTLSLTFVLCYKREKREERREKREERREKKERECSRRDRVREREREKREGEKALAGETG